jgi:hypothetical protein
LWISFESATAAVKSKVAAMFAEEQPTLQPLPLEPFRYYRFGVRTVHLDGCVEIDAAYYSAPLGWIGRRVSVQWNDLHVRLLNPTTGQLLREHVRAPRGWHRIDDADRPSRTPAKTLAALSAAHRHGQEPSRAGHRARGHPARLSCHLSRSAHAPGRSRRRDARRYPQGLPDRAGDGPAAGHRADLRTDAGTK